jgi:dihydrofolate reductase
MSLDGFVAGANQSLQEPLGTGGEQLHEWVFPLEAWRRPHGMEGGEVNESTPVIEEELANIGATIMGRKMFGGGPGPWSKTDPWNGWWGRNPPFHHPVFVLTHHAREPLMMEGGTSFTFVTDGSRRDAQRVGRMWRCQAEPRPRNSTSTSVWLTKCSFTRCQRCSAGASACSTTSRACTVSHW